MDNDGLLSLNCDAGCYPVPGINELTTPRKPNRRGVDMRSFLYVLLLSMIALQVQAVQLHVADTLIVHMIDGTKVERPLLSHKGTFTLSAGDHFITLRYKDVIPDPDLGYESVISSKPFRISINMKQGESYYLEPEKKAFENKQAFAEKPVVVIRSQSGELIYAENLGHATTEHHRDIPSTKVVHQKGSVIVEKAPSTHVQTQSESQTAYPGERLRYWWMKADRETRKSFMGWAIEN
ncbi:MAG: DUF2057 domain-containing protein [Candidatus Thiodiazotropha sp. (ex Monitilora ramsayi)]|nr:DUF2057 domain-containing protein [Candidatus Thiodiazotropha sp. (ex Monitilora ramsayi)]